MIWDVVLPWSRALARVAELGAMPALVEMDTERLARTCDIGLMFVRTPDRQDAFHQLIDCGTYDAMRLFRRASAEKKAMLSRGKRTWIYVIRVRSTTKAAQRASICGVVQ